MTLAKWTDDAFLDDLRQRGDVLADRTVKRLHAEHGIERVNEIFQLLRADHEPLPADAPAPFRDFMAATDEPPAGLDVGRLNRGAETFRTHAFPAAVVLLASSLPCGYSAPCLSRVLTVSDNLGNHPYRRLMGVLQLIVNVSSQVPTAGDERAHLTARKLRLLHAGIRYIIPRHRPEYRERFGVPCNLEDILGTIMGFFGLVIAGLGRLGVGLTGEQAEDYYYVWRAFSLMMGIHPPGEPQNDEYLPRTVAEAGVFYDSYARRNFAPPEENPDGVRLARINLEMMRALIPGPARALGLAEAPEIAMHELLGADGMRRVGIEPPTGHRIERKVFETLLRAVQKLAGEVPEHFVSRLGLLLFQHMIDESLGGEARYQIPPNLEAIRREL